MRLFYKVDPSKYDDLMETVKRQFGMRMEVDEEKTILRTEDESSIETVVGSFDPSSDETAMIRVVLIDEGLRARFDSIFGEPYLVK